MQNKENKIIELNEKRKVPHKNKGKARIFQQWNFLITSYELDDENVKCIQR